MKEIITKSCRATYETEKGFIRINSSRHSSKFEDGINNEQLESLSRRYLNYLKSHPKITISGMLSKENTFFYIFTGPHEISIIVLPEHLDPWLDYLLGINN